MEDGKKKAPAYVQGIRPLDVKELLAKASEKEMKGLMAEDFALWATYSGVEVDGRHLEFDNHRYLLPIYQDNSKEIVWMKAAQLGATVYLLLRLLWFCRNYTLKAGLYFPTGEGVEVLSKDRLKPLINSNLELATNINDDANTLGLKQINNIYHKLSSLYMLYVGGRASKDSVPLDVIAFDEVRLIDPLDIDQCMERISHSSMKYQMFMSTAGLPESDIHARFLRGTQLTWHVKCNCSGGMIPSECFPDCIVERIAKGGEREVLLRCPVCKYIIRDPQNGNYVAHNPTADFNSYAVSQLISKFISPKEIWDAYKTTTNKQEFYNAKLGMPFVDKANRPVSDDVFNGCINPDIKWYKHFTDNRQKRAVYAMGIDQHRGNCFVVIVKRDKDGNKQLAHLELIDSENPAYWEANPNTGQMEPVSPFKRVYKIYKEFNIGLGIVDAMPNANEATQLARDMTGRCYIAWYKDTPTGDMVSWTDRVKYKEAVKKGSQNIKLKWQVTLNRYQSLDFTLGHFVDRAIQIPPVSAFTQVARNMTTGHFEEIELANELREHAKRMIRQKRVLDENTGRHRMEWVQVGGEAHWIHALNYALIAMERLRRATMFSFA